MFRQASSPECTSLKAEPFAVNELSTNPMVSENTAIYVVARQSKSIAELMQGQGLIFRQVTLETKSV
jgi:hypothetical protein